MAPDGATDTADCTLCGQTIASEPVESDADEQFCSPGCRDVYAEFESDAGDERPTEAEATEARATDAQATAIHATEAQADDSQADDSRANQSTTDAAARCFLRIDGMHSVTCETFLESRATALEGVSDATASYVTETIRVEHDDGVTPGTLQEELSTLGYTAYLREEVDGDTRDPADATRRTREMSGMRKRRSEQFLQFRYAAGVLFAAFLLLPYVVLVYPSHLASLTDVGFLEVYRGSFRLEGQAGVLFLRFYLLLTGVVLLFTGMPVLRGALVSLRTRRPNTDLLVATTALSAVAYSVLAVPAGRTDVYFDLAIVVATAVTAAAFYETATKQRALERLTDLTISNVTDARRYREDGRTETVSVDELSPGDRVLVRAGERVPVDGTLAGDGCTVDEAVVTGESLPVRKLPGDSVVGGSVVADGAAVVTVPEERSSTIDRITRSVWDIQSADHGVQRRADHIAAIAIPVVTVLAVAAAAYSIATGGTQTAALLAALATLVVASPWALGLATPLSVASSVRAAMDRGIVVFDESIFERLLAVDVVVFDKTGTLTAGATDVLEADAPRALMEAVAALEQQASHPAAAAIAATYGPDGEESAPDGETSTRDSDAPEAIRASVGGDGESGDDGESDSVDEATAHGSDRVSDFERYDAGVGGTVGGERVLAGSLDLFAARDWTVPEELAQRVREARGFGRLPVVVGSDGRAEGLLVVGDEPREGWEETVARLDDRGVDVVVLTGDDAAATEFFSRRPEVEHVFTGVPPSGKTEVIRRLAADSTVAMVGDGTNDAPALATADLGVSLGSGTALAADAADLTIASDDLQSVETAFELAGGARRRVRENSALALAYNGIAIPVAAVGLLNPVTAMGAVVVCGGLLAVNAMRPVLDSDADADR